METRREKATPSTLCHRRVLLRNAFGERIAEISALLPPGGSLKSRWRSEKAPLSEITPCIKPSLRPELMIAVLSSFNRADFYPPRCRRISLPVARVSFIRVSFAVAPFTHPSRGIGCVSLSRVNRGWYNIFIIPRDAGEIQPAERIFIRFCSSTFFAECLRSNRVAECFQLPSAVSHREGWGWFSWLVKIFGPSTVGVSD